MIPSNADQFKSLNLSLKLLSTFNTNNSFQLKSDSKPKSTLQKLKNRLTQANKKFQHDVQRSENTLMWIKQQGINLNNVRIIADQQQRKQEKSKLVQSTYKSSWQEYERKQYENLSFQQFVRKNKERIAYNTIKRCLEKTDNRTDHMRALRKRNLNRFNGVRMEQKQTSPASDQSWQIVMEQYERFINKNTFHPECVNLVALSEDTLNIFSRYKPQFLVIFDFFQMQNKQWIKSCNRLNKPENIQEARVLQLFINSLRDSQYKNLVQKYDIFQQRHEYNKYCILFFQIFVQIIQKQDKIKIQPFIIREILLKMASFVHKCKNDRQKLFLRYYFVFLECLLFSQGKLNPNELQKIVQQSCKIVDLDLHRYQQYQGQDNLFSQYLKNITKLRDSIQNNINNNRQIRRFSKLSI